MEDSNAKFNREMAENRHRRHLESRMRIRQEKKNTNPSIAAADTSNKLSSKKQGVKYATLINNHSLKEWGKTEETEDKQTE